MPEGETPRFCDLTGFDEGREALLLVGISSLESVGGSQVFYMCPVCASYEMRQHWKGLRLNAEKSIESCDVTYGAQAHQF